MHDFYAATTPSTPLDAPVQAIVDFLAGSAEHGAALDRHARAANALAEIIDAEPLIELPAPRPVADLDAAWGQARATVAEGIDDAHAGSAVAVLGRAADALHEARVEQ